MERRMSTYTPSNRTRAARGLKFALRAALVSAFLVVPHLCAARTAGAAGAAVTNTTPTPTPAPSPDPSPAPLTGRERAMLELIKGLQERVTRLEAQVTGAEEAKTADA